MILYKIIIKNFRSISDITIETKTYNNRKCLILVGKNEAGKSNILKAVSAAFGKYTVSKKDQNKNMLKGDESCIDVQFKLEKKELDIIIKELCEKKHIKQTNIFKNNLDLMDFIKEAFENILLTIDIDDNKQPRITYYDIKDELNKKYKLLDKLSYSKENGIVDNIETSCDNGSNIENLLIDDLVTNIFKIIKSDIAQLDMLLNKAIIWEYKDEYILPSEVDIESFKSDPNICLPLKNIFYLNGIKDIKNELDSELEKDHSLCDFLDTISEKVTQEFREIWSDLANIKFSISKDGSNFIIRLKEQKSYNNNDRSDGFKRFIAILLILSVQYRTKELSGGIILFDEPDAFLYPTSAKFLKEELFRISENSTVIYSTHSPFMIDNECIERHLIIERKDDISEIVPQGKSPFQEDELLKRAIGSHIFESIQSKNIIFEGYTDYKVFKNTYKNKDFKDCGLVYMGGIKEVNTITTMIMLTGKKFLIVSDSDETSKNKRKDFEKDFPDLKENWLEYDEVCDKSNKIKTLEDFYEVDYLSAKIKQYNENYEYDKKKSNIDNIDKAVSQDKEKRQEIKNALAIDAKKENIKKEYFDFIKKIKNKLDIEN